MKEASLVRAIQKAVRQEHPRAFVVKLADRHTRGLPDLLIVLPGITLFVEVKVPGGTIRPIQRLVHDEIERAGGCVIVAYSVEEVLDQLRSKT